MPPPIACGKCNAVLDEPSDLSPEKRSPCPHCGSMARAFYVTATGGFVLGGAAVVGVGHVTHANLLLRAVVVPGAKTGDGHLIESVAPAWFEIARLMKHDPSVLYQ